MINFLGIFIMSPFQNMDYKKKAKGGSGGWGRGVSACGGKHRMFLFFSDSCFLGQMTTSCPLKQGEIWHVVFRVSEFSLT